MYIRTNIIYYTINQSNKKDDKAANTADVHSSPNTEVSSDHSCTNINSTKLSTPNYHPNNDEANDNAKTNTEIPNLNPSSFLPGSLQPNTLTNQFQMINQPVQSANKNSLTLKVQQMSEKMFCLMFALHNL